MYSPVPPANYTITNLLTPCYTCHQTMLHLARHFTASARRRNPFLYPKSATDLATRIDTHILHASTVNADTAVSALQACRELQNAVTAGDKLERDPATKKIVRMVEAVVACDKVPMDEPMLKRVLLLRFPGLTAVRILQAYHQRRPDAVVALETALVPFRAALFDADIKNALRICDLTTGHANYVAAKAGVLRRGVYRLAGTAIALTAFSKLGVQQVIGMGWLSPAWAHLGSINAMVLTYLINLSFFVAIVKFGRQLSTAGGDVLTWQKGTFYTHWYKHADEMAMCARLMETDLALNGGLENTPALVEELCRKDDNVLSHHTLRPGLTRDGHKVRLLEPRDNLADLKMQAYWMSGGDGFEWVEPDQDPAEIVWRQHLALLHKPVLTALDSRSLKWAEDLIDSRGPKDM